VLFSGGLTRSTTLSAFACFVAVAACGSSFDAGTATDAGEAGKGDDSGAPPVEGGGVDSGGGPPTDAGSDAGHPVDAGHADGSKGDAAAEDSSIPAPDGCVLSLYYKDGDGDGYGGTTSTMACAPPDATWVTDPGDCDDSNMDVHPKQTKYFVAGYIPPGMTTKSFDYNCDGVETEQGNPPKEMCMYVAGVCQGAGYLKASPLRTGTGVDPFCGSTIGGSCYINTQTACVPGGAGAMTALPCQ
jgi:hypothetical protein